MRSLDFIFKEAIPPQNQPIARRINPLNPGAYQAPAPQPAAAPIVNRDINQPDALGRIAQLAGTAPAETPGGVFSSDGKPVVSSDGQQVQAGHTVPAGSPGAAQLPNAGLPPVTQPVDPNNADADDLALGQTMTANAANAADQKNLANLDMQVGQGTPRAPTAQQPSTPPAQQPSTPPAQAPALKPGETVDTWREPSGTSQTTFTPGATKPAATTGGYPGGISQADAEKKYGKIGAEIIRLGGMDAYNKRPKDAAGNLALLKQLQTGQPPAATTPAAAGATKPPAATAPAATGATKPPAATAPAATAPATTAPAATAPAATAPAATAAATAPVPARPSGGPLDTSTRAWDAQYGNSHNPDGTLKTVAPPKIPPRPAVVGKPSQKVLAWDQQYGATHNPDGTVKVASNPPPRALPQSPAAAKPAAPTATTITSTTSANVPGNPESHPNYPTYYQQELAKNNRAASATGQQVAATQAANRVQAEIAKAKSGEQISVNGSAPVQVGGGQMAPTQKPVNSGLTKTMKNLLRENKLTPVEQMQYFRSIIVENPPPIPPNPYTPPPNNINPGASAAPGPMPQATQAAANSWAAKYPKVVELSKKIGTSGAALAGFILKNTAAGAKGPARFGLKAAGFAVAGSALVQLATSEWTGASKLFWTLGGDMANLIKSSGPAIEGGGGILTELAKKIISSYNSKGTPEQPGQPPAQSSQQSKATFAMKGHYQDLLTVAEHFKDEESWKKAMSNPETAQAIHKIVKCASEALNIDWQKAFADAAAEMQSKKDFATPGFVMFDNAVLKQIKCEYETTGPYAGRTKY